MSIAKLLTTAVTAILLLVGTVCAQEQKRSRSTTSTSPVTVSASAERVRFTAPSTVVHMRLEVYGANGVRLSDFEIRGGNFIDWRLQDGEAKPLSDGAYLCVVTVKSRSGRIWQSIASATVEKTMATLRPIAASQLTPQQAQAVGPIEDDVLLILLEDEEPQTPTVIAHDGEDGQLIRGRGALTFRLGDFYSGKDTEQMRLTAEGNLGIGVTNPQAKLDVGGRIRVSEGIVFPDGSVQLSAARKTFGAGSLLPGQSKASQGKDFETLVATSGTGTTGKIPKWQDGPNGVLDDSNISELSGNIGIGVTPAAKLDVAGNINTSTQYNIGNNRVLSVVGVGNIFAGLSAGASNTSGSNNSFVGASAGSANTTGLSNSFFGSAAGRYNATGAANAFFGTDAGLSNWSGSSNSFFGYSAGALNTTGDSNTFVGDEAGLQNTTGSNNSFIGMGSGFSNTTGIRNSFVGRVAGNANSTGSGNSFFGDFAGTLNTTGGNNTIIGTGANVGANSLSNATAIGANSLVSQSNSLVLGSGVNVGIGTAAPLYKLHVVGQDLRVESNSSSIFPRFSLNFTGGAVDEKRWQNYATANALAFSALNDAENAETVWLLVNRGSGAGTAISSVVFPNGYVAINNLARAGTTPLCRNASLQVSTCSSSIHYKQNVHSFHPGLSLIKQLRPVSFNWRGDNQADLGLVAEEVAKVEPLLTTTNEKGEIEGVKYDRVGVVLVNAVQEQQTQIDALSKQNQDQQNEFVRQQQQIQIQQKQLDEQYQTIQKQETRFRKQQSEIEALKILVCSRQPTAETCKLKK